MYVDRTEIADRLAALALATVHMAAVAEQTDRAAGVVAGRLQIIRELAYSIGVADPTAGLLRDGKGG
jgi:hypothetical protein